MSGGVTCELVAWAAARVDWLREGLLGWFERFGRCFPWREPGRSAYEVTVAEILLQRTTAAQVAQVYPDFLRRYPAWDSLARATPAELEGVLRPLGLWRQKARALPRGAARPHAGNAPGIRAPAGHRPVYGERRAGRRLRASGAAPRCQPGPTPGAVLWPLPDLIAEQPPAAASGACAAPRAG